MFGVIGPVDTAVVLIYFTVIAFMGVSLWRRQNFSEEYFVGRRNMHWLMVGISNQASLNKSCYLTNFAKGSIFNLFVFGTLPAIFTRNLSQ